MDSEFQSRKTYDEIKKTITKMKEVLVTVLTKKWQKNLHHTMQIWE